MTAAPLIVVFSDLDGTLLDHDTYRWDEAAATLERLRSNGVPVVLSSSKTRDEMLAVRAELANHHPFIVENGAAVVMPHGYFGQGATAVRRALPRATDSTVDGNLELTVGRPRSVVLERLAALRQEGFAFEGFADWSVDEIAAHTGLPPEAATRAAHRSATEPILWRDALERLSAFRAALQRDGLALVEGGRFLHVMDAFDKADGVRALLAGYRAARPATSVVSIGLGDGPNDEQMLRAVDRPVLVRGRRSEAVDSAAIRHMIRTESSGPRGWAEALGALLDELGPGQTWVPDETGEPGRRMDLG